MSQHYKQKKHLEALGNIKSIIIAMKNLSLMEIKKISKFSQEQTKVLTAMEKTGADFLNFYPDLREEIKSDVPSIYIVLGSERGFCGAFNENLIAAYKKHAAKFPTDHRLILIGNKLATKAHFQGLTTTIITGATTAEEIPNVILSLLKGIGTMHYSSWIIIHNGMENSLMTTKTFQMSEQLKFSQKTTFSYPPLLYLDSKNFFVEFLDQYILAAMSQIFYQSFFAEHQQRYRHTDGAVHWLEKAATKFLLKFNAMRQEEITEAIEEMMLSISTLGD